MRDLVLRTATKDDAADIAALVVRTLQTVNAQDYSSSDIARTVSHFDPQDVADRLSDKTTIVAVRDKTVVGTARLTKARTGTGVSLRTVFVCPRCHGQGIGRAMYDSLMQEIPHGTRITVRSSLYAKGFYAQLGFRKLRDLWEGTEQTIEMVRHR